MSKCQRHRCKNCADFTLEYNGREVEVCNEHEIWGWCFVEDKLNSSDEIPDGVKVKKQIEGLLTFDPIPFGVSSVDINNEFDEKISHKEKIRNRFTSTLDNEGKVTLLLLDIKDECDCQEREQCYIAGYFWAEDSLPGFRSETGNEMELLYLDVNPAEPSTEDFLETASHEFEHLVHWSYAEVRTWLVFLPIVAIVSFLAINCLLGKKWKGKL